MKETIKESNEWKKVLADFLKKLGIIQDKFTGNLTIDFSQGGVGCIKRTEHL